MTLTAERVVELPPHQVYGMFGSGSGAGWLFDAHCAEVAVGAMVTLRVPLESGGGRPADIVGRISGLAAGRRIDITHHLPWRGRLRMRFDPRESGGTRVRVTAEIGSEALPWLMRRRGIPATGSVPEGAHPVGLLCSKSGPASVFAAATENLALLGAEQVNADGGVNGREMRVLVGDDATDPRTAAAETRRLIRAGCRAIITNVTSQSFNAISAVARRAGVLVIYTPVNEGGPAHDLVFRLGERPEGQLDAAVRRLMGATGGRHWYLAGNDYSWPRDSNVWARRVIARHGGAVVGETYRALGTDDFSSLIDDIAASGADLVLSTFVGADEVAFEQQCHAMGLRAQCRTLALALDEFTRSAIGDAASSGLWSVFGYFENLDNAANRALVDSYYREFGRWAPPPSSITESVYEALHLYTGAARAAGDDEPLTIARELRGRSFDGPRGTVAISGPNAYRQPLMVAEAGNGGFSLVAEVEPSRERDSARLRWS
ncbi:ABC transporter substrate-binding protein [Marinitenerispora sediminis]|uniref:ABC transporter substrate-binding protein n=1 Tax=Marinitenerispora sediminis TaxID=1931232 RepID=A0A368TAB9_9ACTN|nr:ABC transporter substrate-binding protein [Marinitenerispora sediminis]RCV56831.1 ABC transporter substrate-binding protein [Marinitenerispora sediminis]RCV61542.1 ABC transporter substrate-binding protein [Marinitenerispora sediminis]